MFESFNPKDKKLTSLDLGTPAPRPAPAPTPKPKPEAKAEAKPPAVQFCVAQTQTLEGAYAHFTGARRKFDDMVKTGLKPEFLFYAVFPQQGLTHSLTTSDGLKTIVPLFNSRQMAEAYIAAKKFAAVPAVCRTDNLFEQAERWIASGINSYALNVCCRCFSVTIVPISGLQTEELFLSAWRLDLANRRHFAENYGRNAANVIASNPTQARIWFEGLRDHVDGGNPYLHWIVAILAGMAGDMDANAASIKRLESFGPLFTGKLQGTSFDPMVKGSQFSTMTEVMLGLGVSLGYVDPGKIAQAPKPASE